MEQYEMAGKLLNDAEEQVIARWREMTDRVQNWSYGFRWRIFNWEHYFLTNERGVGVIEVVLILVVLIALVLVFKERINSLLEDIFNQIDTSAARVY